MSTPARITGTFIDEITHDIPSQNWGVREWRREFELYSKIGVDTVIIIRGGYKNRCIFPAKSIPDLLPVYEDLAELFLSLADEFGIDVFFGTYDSGYWWWMRSWWKEVDLNKAFVDEVARRYGHHASFKGWYLTHETSKDDAHITEIFNAIGGHCKEVKAAPRLISPYPQGAKQGGGGVMELNDSLDHWNHIFEATKGAFDICAFQDGQIHYHELPRFLQSISELGAKCHVEIWSNLELFDRDMPIKFPPADWRNLRFKMEAASHFAKKLIGFEMPHFMSPHSSYASARNLFERYREFAGLAAGPDFGSEE